MMRHPIITPPFVIGLGIILVTTICTTIAVSVGTQRPDALGALMSLTT